MKTSKSGLFLSLLSHEEGFKHENTCQTNEKNYKHCDRVYCEESGHESGDSQTVNDIEENRLILSIRKLCVNSVRNKH